MSGESSSEKTEQPTNKKLRDLRKKGQVPVSKEVVSTAMIVVIFGYFTYAWHAIVDLSEQIILSPLKIINLPFQLALKYSFEWLLYASAQILIPFLVIILLVGMLANILQNGIVYSAESLKLDIKKIDPVEGFKKIFSANNFVEFLKSIVKVLAVSVCVAWVIYTHIGDLIYGISCGLNCVFFGMNQILYELLLYSVVVFVIVAFIDLAFQRYNFIKQNRMTKDEVKRDHKESDGDPLIKSKRRKMQRELAQGKKLNAVKNASVVVRNPTHYAVAIRYHVKDAPLPFIIAKGEQKMAQKIIDIAEEYGIPIMENVPLARGLYVEAKVDDYIPIDFIPAVVEALHWVKDNYPSFNQND
jgi:type III secretion protein U